MNLSRFVPAFAVALALTSSVAFAATDGPNPLNRHPNGDAKVATATANSPAQCTALQSQFDMAIKSHETASKAATAKTLRQEGGQLCVSGRTADGIKKLDQALNDIGVKPM